MDQLWFRRRATAVRIACSAVCVDWHAGLHQALTVVAAAQDQLSLLTDHAHRCRAAVDHVECARCGAAHVDNPATTIRPAIRDADDYGFAIASVGHQHVRAERQCPMTSSKRGRAGYFPACSISPP
jgi:hypothetical protein